MSQGYNMSAGHTYKFDFSRFVGALSLVHPFQYFILFVGQVKRESQYGDLQVNVVFHKENIRRVGIYKNGNDLYIKIFGDIVPIRMKPFVMPSLYGNNGIVLADDVDVSTMQVVI